MEHVTKAESLYNKHQYEEALAAYEEAIRLSPNPDPRLYSGRAAVLERLAQEAYEKAKQHGYSENESEVLPSTMSLTVLTKKAVHEMSNYLRGESRNDQYCLEIFRRAITLQDSDAWLVLQELFSETVRLWLRRHPSKDEALRYENEQNYVDGTFTRFWQATNNQHLTFATLPSALGYLRSCLHSVVIDMIRYQGRPKEESIPDYDDVDDTSYSHADSMLVEDHYHDSELWEVIESIIPVEQVKERRAAYLLFHVNLKPSEIMRYLPGEFASTNEISRLKRNITDRILRNADKVRWRLSKE